MIQIVEAGTLFGFDSRSYSPDILESVIPECFYRESRRDRNWTPD